MIRKKVFLDVRNSTSSITENEKIPLQQIGDKSNVAIKFNEGIYEVGKE
jgi:hypothetical protein